MASELSSLDPNYRPNEIGSPWAISGPGYFTDGAHQDHLHIGFKEQITADWKPPADVAAAGTPEAAGAPAAAAAAAPAVARRVVPRSRARRSRRRAGRAGRRRRRRSRSCS